MVSRLSFDVGKTCIRHLKRKIKTKSQKFPYLDAVEGGSLRMPSFCPKLESTIKVMHRRMAKNDQKFTKICFSRELSLKSGKINFHEFWTIFGHSTVHHFYRGLQFRAK